MQETTNTKNKMHARPDWIASAKLNNQFIEIGAAWNNTNKKNEQYITLKINKAQTIDLNKIDVIYFNPNKK